MPVECNFVNNKREILPRTIAVNAFVGCIIFKDDVQLVVSTVYNTWVVGLVLLVVAAFGHVLLPASVRMLLVVPECHGITHRAVSLAQVHVVNIHLSRFVNKIAMYFGISGSSSRSSVFAGALYTFSLGHLPRAIATGTKTIHTIFTDCPDILNWFTYENVRCDSQNRKRSRRFAIVNKPSFLPFLGKENCNALRKLVWFQVLMHFHFYVFIILHECTFGFYKVVSWARFGFRKTQCRSLFWGSIRLNSWNSTESDNAVLMLFHSTAI